MLIMECQRCQSIIVVADATPGAIEGRKVMADVSWVCRKCGMGSAGFFPVINRRQKPLSNLIAGMALIPSQDTVNDEISRKLLESDDSNIFEENE